MKPLSPVLLAALHDHAVADVRSWSEVYAHQGRFVGMGCDQLQVAFSPPSPPMDWLKQRAAVGPWFRDIQATLERVFRHGGYLIDEPPPQVQAFSGHRSVSVEDYWSLRAAIAVPQPATG